MNGSNRPAEGQTTQYGLKASLLSDLHRWVESHPFASTIPYHLSARIDQVERGDKALDFRVKNPTDHEKLLKIKGLVETECLPRAKRRKAELALADYIEKKVVPLGLDSKIPEIPLKLRACRQSGVVGINPDGRHLVMWDNKCNLSKLCPDEAREESKRLATRYLPEVERLLRDNPRMSFQYAVFTKQNVPAGELWEGKREMFKDFSNLRRRKCFGAVKGVLAVQEDPLAADLKSWNVHINALLLVDGRFDWGEVRREWGGNVQFISAAEMVHRTKAKLKARGQDVSKMDRTTVLVHAFNEICKYSAKMTGEGEGDAPESSSKVSQDDSIDLLGDTIAKPLKKAQGMVGWPPRRWHEWWHSNKGFRRSRSYGCLYRFDESDSEKMDMSLVEWVGKLRFDGERYRCSIDLILGDKSTKSEGSNRGTSPHSHNFSPGYGSPG